jgi:hypothetical protein
LAIVTKVVDFSDGIQAQTYTMFASEKVSERNENCRFQPAYVRKAITDKSFQVEEIKREKNCFPHLRLEGAKARSAYRHILSLSLQKANLGRLRERF